MPPGDHRADPGSPLSGVAADDVTVQGGRLRSGRKGAGDSYGDVLLRRQMTTIDGFSQWDPASGVGISASSRSEIKSPWHTSPADGFQCR